ncbi:MAG: Tol-Pal system beta propeller repeat protein TolB [Legionella sp.]
MITRLLIYFTLLFSNLVFSVDLELTQGISSALPIAINSFGSTQQAKDLTDLIEHDLNFSGQFKVMPSSAPLDVASWRQAGADSVLSGHVVPIGANRYDVKFELLDAAAHGRLLLTRNFQATGHELRALAHHISDEVYQKLTGERGIFSTRIAYIVVQRSGEQTRYSLEIADVDGYGPQSLLVSSEPIMSPTWSPDGRQIAYVSFEKKRAQIFTVSVENGHRQLLTDFPGINGAPSWAPNGHEMAVVLSKGGSPKIYKVDLSAGSMKQLTFGDAIDTEPRYSPDGKSLLFTSGRGGKPQVYKLTLADGKISRMTFEGNYNARASYTPNQQNIVMLHRSDKNFNIAVQNLPTGQLSQLTFSSFDESPSVSPNGRLILYATHHHDKGVLAVVSLDGRMHVELPSRDGDVQEPTWSPYLG